MKLTPRNVRKSDDDYIIPKSYKRKKSKGGGTASGGGATLTVKRKIMILLVRQYIRAPPGSEPWLHKLFNILKSHDPAIRLSDVKRWCKNHSWIRVRI